MQVSSYLKNAKRSMRHKLIGYMIVLAVLLVAALYAGLTLFGRLSSPKAEIKKALDLQMEIFQNDMESLWHNVSTMSILLSEDMIALLEDTLQQQGISFEDLDGNVEATKAIEDAMLEPLSQYVRQADCSGGFVILESSMSDWDAADARSGLYVQRANAGRVTNNLLLFRGIASVGKAHTMSCRIGSGRRNSILGSSPITRSIPYRLPPRLPIPAAPLTLSPCREPRKRRFC